MTTVAEDRFEELIRMTNDRHIETGALRDQIEIMAGELYDTHQENVRLGDTIMRHMSALRNMFSAAEMPLIRKGD